MDVGGGNGGLLAAILAAFPQVRGLLFDRAQVVAGAPAVLGEVLDRCSIVAGDFFDAVPSGGDVYLLALILHDWSDERCAAILAACRRAMRPGARLLVIERLLGPDADPMNHLADMHMMLLFPGAPRAHGGGVPRPARSRRLRRVPRHPDRLALPRPGGAGGMSGPIPPGRIRLKRAYEPRSPR